MIELPSPPLGDEVISLRPWGGSDPDGDARTLAAAWADPEIGRWNKVPEGVGVPDAAEWIRGDLARRTRDLSVDLAIVSALDASLVWGEVGLSNIDHERSGAEIGFWIGSDHRRSGLATRAIAVLTEWTIDGPLGLGRVYARTAPGNVASARALVNAGYLLRGRLSSGHDLWSRS